MRLAESRQRLIASSEGTPGLTLQTRDPVLDHHDNRLDERGSSDSYPRTRKRSDFHDVCSAFPIVEVISQLDWSQFSAVAKQNCFCLPKHSDIASYFGIDPIGAVAQADHSQRQGEPLATAEVFALVALFNTFVETDVPVPRRRGR
jgi:hypothetical protein